MKITYNGLNKRILYSIILIGASILIYTQVFLEGYKNQFILPLVYLVFYVWLLEFSQYKYNKIDNKNIIIKALNIITFIKYVISPLSYIYIIRMGGWAGQNSLGFGPEPDIHSINCAILLQSLEIIIISFILIIYVHFKKERKRNCPETFLENKSILIIFLLITPLLGVLNRKLNLDIIKAFSNFSPLILLLFWVKICYRLKLSNNVKVLLSLLGLAIYLFSRFDSLSRWNLLFITIAYLVILKRLYGKISKKLVGSLLIILIILIINISYIKFAWLFEESGNRLEVLIGYYISQIPDYFSGIRPLAQSLILNNKYDITYTTFLNDFFGNIPGFGLFVDNLDRMNVYFNIYNWGYYREVLIIPLLGEGFAFLGYIAPLYSAICLLLVLYMEKIISLVSNIESLFIFTYASLYSCMFLGFDLQIILVHLFTITIPAIVLFSLNNKLKINFK